ncbi:hypothetical protein ADUPG1_009094, partial [Aduncisulcus paluster]
MQYSGARLEIPRFVRDSVIFLPINNYSLKEMTDIMSELIQSRIGGENVTEMFSIMTTAFVMSLEKSREHGLINSYSLREVLKVIELYQATRTSSSPPSFMSIVSLVLFAKFDSFTRKNLIQNLVRDLKIADVPKDVQAVEDSNAQISVKELISNGQRLVQIGNSIINCGSVNIYPGLRTSEQDHDDGHATVLQVMQKKEEEEEEEEDAFAVFSESEEEEEEARRIHSTKMVMSSALEKKDIPTFERPLAHTLGQKQLEVTEKISSILATQRAIILSGMSGTGKSKILQILAKLCRKNLHTIQLNCDSEVGNVVGRNEPVVSKSALDLGQTIQTAIKQIITPSSSTTSEKDEQEESHFDCLNIQTYGKKLKKLRRHLYKLLGGNVTARKFALKHLESLSPLFKNAKFIQNNSSSVMNIGFVESPLISAMKNGDWVALESLQAAKSDVFERLNSLTEEDMRLDLYEKDANTVFLKEQPGVRLKIENGEIPIHPDFRLFMTVDPYSANATIIPASFQSRCVLISTEDFYSNESDLCDIAIRVLSQDDLLHLSKNEIHAYSSVLAQSFVKFRKHWSKKSVSLEDKQKFSVRAFFHTLNSFKILCAEYPDRDCAQMLYFVLKRYYGDMSVSQDSDFIIKTLDPMSKIGFSFENEDNLYDLSMGISFVEALCFKELLKSYSYEQSLLCFAYISKFIEYQNTTSPEIQLSSRTHLALLADFSNASENEDLIAADIRNRFALLKRLLKRKKIDMIGDVKVCEEEKDELSIIPAKLFIALKNAISCVAHDELNVRIVRAKMNELYCVTHCCMHLANPTPSMALTSQKRSAKLTDIHTSLCRFYTVFDYYCDNMDHHNLPHIVNIIDSFIMDSDKRIVPSLFPSIQDIRGFLSSSASSSSCPSIMFSNIYRNAYHILSKTIDIESGDYLNPEMFHLRQQSVNNTS